MLIKYREFVKRGGWWVVVQFLWFGAILLALTGNREPAPPAAVAGWLLIAAALGFAGSGLYVLRDKLTAMPAPVDDAVLQRSGPYTLVRHPIYTGVILGFLGLTIKGANPVGMALALGLIPFFYAKTRHEERLLTERFPDYTDYREAVPYRLLPWLL